MAPATVPELAALTGLVAIAIASLAVPAWRRRRRARALAQLPFPAGVDAALAGRCRQLCAAHIGLPPGDSGGTTCGGCGGS